MIATHVNGFYKYYFRFLEKISGKLACRTGVKVWLTPPKYKPTLPENAILQSSTVKRIPFKESAYQATLETYYTLYSWGSGPVVLLVHGWGTGAASMTPLVKPLTKAGYRVVAFDALGHGDASGKRTDIVEIIDIIKDINTKFDFRAIIAHSTGALASVMAISEGVQTEKLVVYGTAASIDYYLREYSKKLGASRPMLGRISYNLNLVLKRNIKEFSIINIVPTLNKPALIIHDQHDEVVAPGEALALSKLWPKSELCLTERLGHFGVLSDTQISLKVLDYIGTPHDTHSAADVIRIANTETERGRINFAKGNLGQP